MAYVQPPPGVAPPNMTMAYAQPPPGAAPPNMTMYPFPPTTRAGGAGYILRNWVVILLTILIIVDYIVLWTRLPFVYSKLVAGTIPFAAAFVYSIHRLQRDPSVRRTLGFKFFMFLVVAYWISMLFVLGQLQKQNCTPTE